MLVHCEEVIASSDICIKRRLSLLEQQSAPFTQSICQTVSRRKSIAVLIFNQIGGMKATGGRWLEAEHLSHTSSKCHGRKKSGGAREEKQPTDSKTVWETKSTTIISFQSIMSLAHIIVLPSSMSAERNKYSYVRPLFGTQVFLQSPICCCTLTRETSTNSGHDI